MTEYGLTRHFTELKRKRAFRKFSYRGVDLDQYVPLDPALRSGCYTMNWQGEY
jgi:hypothetical protein